MLLRYRYITLIKKWPKGVDRWQYMDKYIQQFKHPVIKNFTDYNINKITSDYPTFYLNYEIFQYNVPQMIEDDQKLVADISGLTLKSFIKDAFNSKTRKEQHVLPLYILACLGIALVNLLAALVWEKKTEIRQIDLTPNQYYDYPLTGAERELEGLRNKILIAKQEYKDLLEKTRNNQIL